MKKSPIITAGVAAVGLFTLGLGGVLAAPPSAGIVHAVQTSVDRAAGHDMKTGHGYERGDRGFVPMMRRLDLTPEQRERMRDVLRQDADERKAKATELREVQQEMRRYSFGSGFDSARIGELAQRQGALMAELQMMRAERLNVVYQEVLTDEQRAKLDEWRSEGKKYMPRKHHHRDYGRYEHSDRHDRGKADRTSL